MDDLARVSYWLESAGDDLAPRAPLDGSVDADVAILGAGYTGLWTALYLLRRDPSLRVVVLEREVAGFGASGRNGAWCSGELNIGLDLIAERHGRDAALAIRDAMAATVDEVGAAASDEHLEIDFRKGGALLVARGAHELPALRATAAEAERFGTEGVRVLDPSELADRLRVDAPAGALFQPDCAALHPGKLVRGLARAVEARGGVVHERTPVTSVLPAGAGGHATAALRTPAGDVRASAVVLAGEAYLTELAAYHRRLLPIYSLIVLTEPLSDEQWAGIGWEGHECVASFRLTVDYLSRTPDGRILFGGRGAPYHFGSAIRPPFDRDERTHAMLRRMLVRWFPSLRGVGFTHAWGGPLAMPRDWMPSFGFDERTGIAHAYGYTGHGVATANLAGRTLADLITGNRSDLTSLAFVGHHSRSWEPEPLRWIGVRYVQLAYERLDRLAERDGRAPSGRSIAERITRH